MIVHKNYRIQKSLIESLDELLNKTYFEKINESFCWFSAHAAYSQHTYTHIQAIKFGEYFSNWQKKVKLKKKNEDNISKPGRDRCERSKAFSIDEVFYLS